MVRSPKHSWPREVQKVPDIWVPSAELQTAKCLRLLETRIQEDCSEILEFFSKKWKKYSLHFSSYADPCTHLLGNRLDRTLQAPRSSIQDKTQRQAPLHFNGFKVLSLKLELFDLFSIIHINIFGFVIRPMAIMKRRRTTVGRVHVLLDEIDSWTYNNSVISTKQDTDTVSNSLFNTFDYLSEKFDYFKFNTEC